MVGGGERYFMLDRIRTRSQSERPFGGNMHCVGLLGLNDLRHAFERKQRQPNFGIGRARYGAKQLRRDHHHLMPHFFQLAVGRLYGAYHAIDLRQPCVGDD